MSVCIYVDLGLVVSVVWVSNYPFRQENLQVKRTGICICLHNFEFISVSHVYSSQVLRTLTLYVTCLREVCISNLAKKSASFFFF